MQVQAAICICNAICKNVLCWFQNKSFPGHDSSFKYHRMRGKKRKTINYVRRKHCNRHISKMFSWYFYQRRRSRPISISFAQVNWLPCFFNINHAAHICKVFLVSVFVSVKVNDWFIELSFKSWCSVIHFLVPKGHGTATMTITGTSLSSL